MNILGTIDRCISMIPKELIEGNILYAELDKESYALIQEEVKSIEKVDGGITLSEDRFVDFGKSLVIKFMDYKVIVVLNKDKPKADNFYLAFKTKII